MEEYTYIEALVEDESGRILVNHILEKYVGVKENIQYRVHGFKGIGKIPAKAKNQKQVKTGRLLNDLPNYLRGMSSYMENMPGKKAIFVLLDCDDEDCAALKSSLLDMCGSLGIATQVFFCIAIEEMEAWLLGDKDAILEVYPHAKRAVLQKYKQDTICGTWECLAEVIYEGGLQRLKKIAMSYYEIGKFKIECAEKIGSRLSIDKNQSPSFNYFISKLEQFCGG